MFRSVICFHNGIVLLIQATNNILCVCYKPVVVWNSLRVLPILLNPPNNPIRQVWLYFVNSMIHFFYHILNSLKSGWVLQFLVSHSFINGVFCFLVYSGGFTITGISGIDEMCHYSKLTEEIDSIKPLAPILHINKWYNWNF